MSCVNEDGGGKIIHLYTQKIDSFVEQQRPKYLNAYWMYKL